MVERAAAEDLLQDVFVAFARRQPELSSSDDAKKYLVTSCVHRARDLRRRRPLAPAGDALERAASPDDDALAQAAAGDESELVRAALRELPDEQRHVVTLHLHGGLKFREIAEAMAIPIDTVTSRYRYGLEKLDRKSTRLNSSLSQISYAVFCL